MFDTPVEDAANAEATKNVSDAVDEEAVAAMTVNNEKAATGEEGQLTVNGVQGCGQRCWQDGCKGGGGPAKEALPGDEGYREGRRGGGCKERGTTKRLQNNDVYKVICADKKCGLAVIETA